MRIIFSNFLKLGFWLWLLWPSVCIPLQAQPRRQYFFEVLGLEQGLPVRRINAMSQTACGDYWLASEGAGLVHYDGYAFHDYFKERFPVIDQVRCYGDTLICFSAGARVIWFSPHRSRSFHLPEGYTVQRFAAERPAIWDQTGQQWQPRGDTLVLVQGAPGPPPRSYSLLSDSAFSLAANDTLSYAKGLPRQPYHGAFEDRQGHWWLLGAQSVVRWLGPQHYRYRLLSEAQNLYLYKDHLLVSSEQGLELWHLPEGRLRRYPRNVVLDFAEHQGVLYLASEKGLYIFDGEALRPLHLPGLPELFIFSLYSQGEQLWIGAGSGIYRLQGGNCVNVGERQNFDPGTVYHIDGAADGSLWFGSYTEGFFRKSGGDWRQFERFQDLDMAGLQLNTFAAQDSQTLWLGTLNDGLYRAGLHQAPWHLSFEAAQFAEIRSLAYHEGRLWLGTNKGYQELAVQNLTDLSGRTLAYQSGAACLNHAIQIWPGKVALATANGWHVRATSENPLRRPVIESLDLLTAEQPVNLYARWRDSLAEPRLNLAYDRNYVRMVYGVRFAEAPRRMQYRYRLLGQQSGWTYAGTRREALFNNLKPGDYQFEVQVAPAGGAWTATMARASFYIRPPFWQTWWFIAAAVGILASLIALYLRLRIRRVSRQLQLEKLVLESERKALRLQMNPHFIFNALESISSFIFKNDSRQAVRYLNNFAKLMRLTLESSVEHVHPVETEVSILKNYLELEKLRFGSQFEYQIDLSEDFDFSVGIPPMMIQPHVENAIIHGLKPRKEGGLLKLSFALEQDWLVCVVEDNGIGRAAARRRQKGPTHRSMATKINKDRLELLGRSLHKPVRLEVEDLYQANGEAAGTRVRLHIPYEEL